MATMLITEFSEVVRDGAGNILPLAKNPPVAEQSPVTVNATSAQSAAFNQNTHLVSIVCDGIAHLAFGVDPTASTSSTQKIEARTPQFFGVTPGHKVAAVSGS